MLTSYTTQGRRHGGGGWGERGAGPTRESFRRDRSHGIPQPRGNSARSYPGGQTHQELGPHEHPDPPDSTHQEGQKVLGPSQNKDIRNPESFLPLGGSP